MAFFGREEELLSLRGWLETAARRVTSQMLAVTGRHGAGKTRLLAEDFAAESRFGRPRGGSAAFCRPLPPPTKSRVCSSSMSAKNLTGWW